MKGFILCLGPILYKLRYNFQFYAHHPLHLGYLLPCLVTCLFLATFFSFYAVIFERAVR